MPGVHGPVPAFGSRATNGNSTCYELGVGLHPLAIPCNIWAGARARRSLRVGSYGSNRAHRTTTAGGGNGSREASGVLQRVVLVILTAAHRLHPLLVSPVPVNGLLQASLEIGRGPPTQLLGDPAMVHRIPPIRDRGDRARPINRSGLDALQHQQHRCAEILDVNPIPPVRSVAIDRQWLADECVRDHEWNQLLGKLVGPVRIGRPENDRRHTVGMCIRLYQKVGGRLGGAVGLFGASGVSSANLPVGPAPAHRRKPAAWDGARTGDSDAERARRVRSVVNRLVPGGRHP